MNIKVKYYLKKIIPPIFIDLFNLISSHKAWIGDYQTWQKASVCCSGYSDAIILKKLIDAQRKVLDGKACFERDTVLFYKPEHNIPLVASLLMAVRNNTLSVVDFGGALGSSFYQNRGCFQQLTVKWGVVEQPHFVAAGIKEFQTSELQFFNDIQSAKNTIAPQVLFSSSTLQYLEKPFSVLNEMISLNLPYMIFDRIAFNAKPKNRITIQRVPKRIYHASYPCWFFSEEDFLSYFKDRYELVWDFNSLDSANIPSYFKGFFFKRKNL